jgi:hypothetical protein
MAHGNHTPGASTDGDIWPSLPLNEWQDTYATGRPAPKHPGAPHVAKFVGHEAYSHEVSSCGFWPGSGLGMPAFYAYAYSEAREFKDVPVESGGAAATIGKWDRLALERPAENTWQSRHNWYR